MRSKAKAVRLKKRSDVLRFVVGETVRIPIGSLLPEMDMSSPPSSGSVTVTRVDYKRGIVVVDVDA